MADAMFPRTRPVFPGPAWPGRDAVKRAAARVGRALYRPPAERAKLESKLADVLDGLDNRALLLWGSVLMIDSRFCPATGTGAYWAVASEAVNRIALGLLAERAATA